MKAVLSLEGLEFYAYHGYYPEERETGGIYKVNIRFTVDITGAATHDDLSGTVNYELVYDQIEEEMKKPCKLIEHLAYNIVNRLKQQIQGIENLELTVFKLDPPLKGKVEQVSVTVKS